MARLAEHVQQSSGERNRASESEEEEEDEQGDSGVSEAEKPVRKKKIRRGGEERNKLWKEHDALKLQVKKAVKKRRRREEWSRELEKLKVGDSPEFGQN